MIELELPFPPSGNERNVFRVRRGKVNVARKKKTQDYFDLVAIMARVQKIEKTLGPVEVHLHFYKPSRRRFDEDNIKKVLYDALVAAQVIEDDSLIRAGSFSFDEEVRKGGLILIRISPYEGRPKFWAL